MSKTTEIWNQGIGSVHGSDVTMALCYRTANDMAVYARKLEAETEELKDKVDAIDSELNIVIETAYNRGAKEWVALNFPRKYKQPSTLG
tara:strand:+ start:2008 stop:2274 length:267 start_codon:yes stop_codon:yes gene_type:complete